MRRILMTDDRSLILIRPNLQIFHAVVDGKPKQPGHLSQGRVLSGSHQARLFPFCRGSRLEPFKLDFGKHPRDIVHHKYCPVLPPRC